MAAHRSVKYAISIAFFFLQTQQQTQAQEFVSCDGLSELACKVQYDPNSGDPYCAYNPVENFCYPVTRAIGSRGQGGFDEGYLNAEDDADAKAKKMETMIIVFSILIGFLLLLGIGLGVYFYRRSQTEEEKDGGYNVPKQQSEKMFGSPVAHSNHKKVNYVDEGDELDL